MMHMSRPLHRTCRNHEPFALGRVVCAARLGLAVAIVLLLIGCGGQGKKPGGESGNPPGPVLSVGATPIPTPPSPPADPSVTPPPDATATASAIRDRQVASRPYPIPASCAVTQAVITEQAGIPIWLQGSGIHAGLYNYGALFQGRNKVLWLIDQRPSGTVAISGQRLDATAPALEVQITEAIDSYGKAVWPSTLSFPTPGCWHIHAQADNQTLDVTTYVYPYTCLPPEQRWPTPPAAPAPCIPPQS